MSYKNGGNPYRPATDPKVVHFIRYYLKHVGIRHAPDRPVRAESPYDPKRLIILSTVLDHNRSEFPNTSLF